MLSPSLNPSAPSFELGAYGGPAINMSSPSTAARTTPSTRPGNLAASATGKSLIDTTTNTARVAAVYGHGWKSSSPPSSAFPAPVDSPTKPTFSTPRRLVSAHPSFNTGALPFKRTNGLSNGYSTLLTVSDKSDSASLAGSRHRPKSPSLPGILPSDELRRGGPPSAADALKHLLTVASADRQSGSAFIKPAATITPTFDPFFDDAKTSHPEVMVVDLGRATHTVLPSTPRTTRVTEPLSPPWTRSPVAVRGGYSRLDSFDHHSSSSGEHESNSSTSDFGERRNVYIPALTSTVTEENLRKAAQMSGRVVSVKIERAGAMTPDVFDMLPDGIHGPARTYAFVMFDTPRSAGHFMQALTESGIPCQYGKETPHLKQKALEDPHSSNLYVAEIPLDATEEDMRNLFHPGVISSLRFLTDDKGNRRGTAMVRLQSRAQAEEAIKRLDLMFVIPGCAKALQVRIADSEPQKQFKRVNMAPRSPEVFDGLRRGSFGSFGSVNSPAPSPIRPNGGSPNSSVLVDSAFEEDDDTRKLKDTISSLQAEVERREAMAKESSLRQRRAINMPITTTGHLVPGLATDTNKEADDLGPILKPLHINTPKAFDFDSFLDQKHQVPHMTSPMTPVTPTHWGKYATSRKSSLSLHESQSSLSSSNDSRRHRMPNGNSDRPEYPLDANPARF